MGFCFFNNVAVAAAHARTLGAARVAIVDYDVHHGNGTQEIFANDPDVLYVSTHQFPYYPGSGDASDVGRGSGAGRTVNLAIEVGATDEDYRLVIDQVVSPVLRQFGPDILLVSAGFDAHERDPLGGMRLTTAGFAAITTTLRQLADELCGGRLVAVTEGGYDLHALGDCLRTVVDVLAPESCPVAPWPSVSAGSTRGQAAASATKAALARYWTF